MFFSSVIMMSYKLIRHDIYPARGRKPDVFLPVLRIAVSLIRHDIYPARGRKHSSEDTVLCCHQ